MFFRSKKSNGKNTSQETASTEPPARTAAAAAAARVPTVTATQKGSRNGVADKPAASAPAAKALAPEELKQRADASKRIAATMGELIGLMARSPRHREHKLADIRWLVVPAIRTGQFLMATAQSKSHGYTAPVAAVMWASVSPDVDKRISDDLSKPIRLAPREWKSGDILWLVDAIGDNRLVGELVKRLHAKEWKGKAVKARVVDDKKQVKIRTIEAQPAKTASVSK